MRKGNLVINVTENTLGCGNYYEVEYKVNNHISIRGVLYEKGKFKVIPKELIIKKHNIIKMPYRELLPQVGKFFIEKQQQALTQGISLITYYENWDKSAYTYFYAKGYSIDNIELCINLIHKPYTA